MQDYTTIAEKNGILLLDHGPCQCCGAATTRGVHECMELFSLGFGHIDYTNQENRSYRFISVDAHTLQHPELHGRWNNHFHLTRQHLMLHHNITWTYALSPKLSDCLNEYKKEHENEILAPPLPRQRGRITTTDILNHANTEAECRQMILDWGNEVYRAWERHHPVAERLAEIFMKTKA